MARPWAWLSDPDALSRVVVAGGLFVLGVFQPASRDMNLPWRSVANPADFNLWKGLTLLPKQVKEREAQGAQVTVLDVRAREAYEREHIEGAVSIPWGELEKGHAMLPKDRFIVLYCT